MAHLTLARSAATCLVHPRLLDVVVVHPHHVVVVLVVPVAVPGQADPVVEFAWRGAVPGPRLAAPVAVSAAGRQVAEERAAGVGGPGRRGAGRRLQRVVL